MATLTQGKFNAEFLLRYQGKYSLDVVTLAASNPALKAGTLLGKITASSATSAAKAGGNTGNGTMGAITVSAGALAGVYKLRITKAATNAGDFEVIDPQGDVVGIGSVAAAYSMGGLAFTLADGATDFAVGDGFDITVTGSGKYVAYSNSATDGSDVVAAILKDNVPDSTADQKVVIVTRMAEVQGSELTGLDDPAKVDLLALGIVVR